MTDIAEVANELGKPAKFCQRANYNVRGCSAAGVSLRRATRSWPGAIQVQCKAAARTTTGTTGATPALVLGREGELTIESGTLELPYDPLPAVCHLQPAYRIYGAAERAEPHRIS
jgi:hypothetical protein